MIKDFRLFMKGAKTNSPNIALGTFEDNRLFMKGAKTQNPKMAPVVLKGLRLCIEGAKTKALELHQESSKTLDFS